MRNILQNKCNYTNCVIKRLSENIMYFNAEVISLQDSGKVEVMLCVWCRAAVVLNVRFASRDQTEFKLLFLVKFTYWIPPLCLAVGNQP